MLTGLIFATEGATDAPDALVATLPFGGATLIEHQARLLVAAGAAQVLIAVARVTPELLGAAARIRRRGTTVDVVRSAGEAAAKVHPLAHVVLLADGLLTDAETLAPFVQDGGDLLLVGDRDQGLERIDADHCWAGIARIAARRLSEAAALPRDYDFLSTLLRVAAQHGAAQVPLPATSRGDGHGIERDARGLARRGRGAYRALTRLRVRWAERWLLAPLARLALPPLATRGASPLAVIGIGAAVGIAGGWAIAAGWPVAGLTVTMTASTILLTGGLLAWLRGDERESAWADHVAAGVAALAVLAVGTSAGTSTETVLACVVVALAALIERLRGALGARRWWASPAAYPLLLLPFAALGQPVVGLAALAAYAALTLFGAIEDAREGLARP